MALDHYFSQVTSSGFIPRPWMAFMYAIRKSDLSEVYT